MGGGARLFCGPSVFILNELDQSEGKITENNLSHFLSKSLRKEIQRVAGLLCCHPGRLCLARLSGPGSRRGSAESLSGCVGPHSVFVLPAPPESEATWHFPPGTGATVCRIKDGKTDATERPGGTLACSRGSWESGSLPQLCTLRKETHQELLHSGKVIHRTMFKRILTQTPRWPVSPFCCCVCLATELQQGILSPTAGASEDQIKLYGLFGSY